MKKVAIIGSKGFLGSKLVSILSKYFEIIPADINEEGRFKLDVTNKREVKNFIEDNAPEVVIYTVALTSSVLCEKNPDLAKQLNFEGVKNFLNFSDKFDKLIFISSSYVFDGKNGGYTEQDEPSPVDVYGKTKLLAEEEILKYKNNLVLRVDLLYGYDGNNSHNGYIGKILDGNEILIGNPCQIRSPLFIDDFATLISKVIGKTKGIMNVTGDEFFNTLDFLNILKDKLNPAAPKIQVLDEKNLIVPPKLNSSLNNSKAKKEFGAKFHTLSESLERIKKEL